MGDFCTGRSDAAGIVTCEAPVAQAGNLILRARATDPAGNESVSVAEAWVAGEAPGDCTVTVIDEGRKKYVAVLKGVTAGTWRCFGADPKLCVADAPPPKKKGK